MRQPDALEKARNGLVGEVQRAGAWVEARTGGIAGTLILAARSFSDAHGAESAAGLAFYAVFSLFPMLGLIVAISSYLIPQQQILHLLVEFFTPVFPVSFDLIQMNLNRFIHLRVGISFAVLIALVWSASNVFAILINQVLIPWGTRSTRNYFQRRLLAFGGVGFLVLIFSLFWLVTIFINLFAQLNIPLFETPGLVDTLGFKIFLQVIYPIFSFCLFFGIYRWVPAERPSARGSLWSAGVVTMAWESTAILFSYYISYQLNSYNYLYGPLAALAVLMFWFYIDSLIVIFGGHLSAALSRWFALIDKARETAR